MGCGQKAVAEDEDAWDDFQTEHNLRAGWDVYSPQARFARDGWKAYNFTGVLLEKFVAIRTEYQKAQDEFTKKLNVLEQARAL